MFVSDYDYKIEEINNPRSKEFMNYFNVLVKKHLLIKAGKDKVSIFGSL